MHTPQNQTTPIQIQIQGATSEHSEERPETYQLGTKGLALLTTVLRGFENYQRQVNNRIKERITTKMARQEDQMIIY